MDKENKAQEQSDIDVNDPSFWSSYYQEGQPPWDLGGEVAAFRGLRDKGAWLAGGARIFVPGCGNGYDALAFARAGYPVTALDFAKEPTEALRHKATQEQLPLEVHCANIFGILGMELGPFDGILEYTCYCAIEPRRREEYVGILAKILAEGGHLFALAYPLVEREGGPPFAVDAQELQALCEGVGLTLIHEEVPPPSRPSREGRERLMVFQKQAR